MPRDEDLIDKNFPEESRSRGSARLISVMAVVMVVVFVAAIGYFYFTSGKAIDPNNLPVIAETNPPEKVKPADPGGMEIPHQDASVYDHLDPKQAAAEPEKLLPAPEAPVNAEQQAATTPAPAPDANGATVPPTTAANIPNQLAGLPSAPADAPKADVAPAMPPEQPAVAAAPEPATTPEAAPAKQADAAPAVEKITQPAATPALVVDTSNNFRIQLSAVRDEAAAKSEWEKLQKKHADALKGLEASFTPVNLGAKGTFLRIQAGPLTHDEADARCAKLKAQNQACLIVKAAQ